MSFNEDEEYMKIIHNNALIVGQIAYMTINHSPTKSLIKWDMWADIIIGEFIQSIREDLK